MVSLGNLRPGLFGNVTPMSRTYVVGHPRQFAVGLHVVSARSSAGNGNICSAGYHGLGRPHYAKLNSPCTHMKLGGNAAPFCPSWAGKLFGSKASDFGKTSHDTGTIRDLLANVYYPKGSHWTPEYEQPSLPVSGVKIVSWNVDFMAPDAATRVSCILNYLQTAIITNDSHPSVLLLQELEYESFDAVLKNSWVREHFAVVPPNTGYWSGSYGLATLVSRHIPIVKAQMLQFRQTRMGRAALFVDVLLQTTAANGEPGPPPQAIRIANTHLESLGEGEHVRPVQLSAIAAMLRQRGIHAGVVGGDMNTILPADQRIHVGAGLRDAGTDGPQANTWGYQSRKRAWQAKRLDRVFYTPTPGLVVEPVEVVGKGLKTERGEWASDHYAIQTTVALRGPGEDKS